jgi:hypothetical protein
MVTNFVQPVAREVESLAGRQEEVICGAFDSIIEHRSKEARSRIALSWLISMLTVENF